MIRFAVIVMAAFLLVSCSSNLKIAEDYTEISSVTLERFVNGESRGAFEITDAHNIYEIYSTISTADKQWRKSVSDTPSVSEYTKISVSFVNSAERLFYHYMTDDMNYIEVPYGGIYLVNWYNKGLIDNLCLADLYIREFGDFTLPQNYNGENKAIDIHTDKDGVKWVGRYKLSDELKSESPDDVRFLILSRYEDEKVGEYLDISSRDSFVANAYRIDEYVTVYDLSAGTVIAEKRFYGGEPSDKIYEKDSALVTGDGQSKYGKEPNRQEIITWITEILQNNTI